MDVKKIETGTLLLHQDFFPLFQLIKGTLNQLPEKVMSQGEIVFNYDTTSNFPLLYGDEARVRQVLINLIINGLTYNDAKEKKIVVDIHHDDQSIYIEVTDNGIGISEKNQKKIFEGFYRADISAARKSGGAGLGLSISEGLIRKMKNNYKIAIVDDEPKIVRFIKANLLSFNYQVCTFSNGEQFLEQFDLHEPDLVLLDVMMPDMDGFTVLKQLRKFSKVPVIFLTARSASDDMLQAFDLEADDYLTKPFSLDELFARVKAVLRRTKVNHELGREESRITTYNLEINIAQKRVYVKGNEVKLTNIEYLILELL